MDNLIISVGRQIGSGGNEIAQMLAREFSCKFYDKEIINLAAEKSGFNPKIFERNDENHGIIQSVADNSGKADIDGVPVEDPGKGRSQDGTDPQSLEDGRGLLAGGPAAEVAVRDDIIAGLYVRREVRIQRFECVSFHFIHSRIEKVLGSDDLIGVHIFVKTEYFTHRSAPFRVFMRCFILTHYGSVGNFGTAGAGLY
jgi:hypothetical protein